MVTNRPKIVIIGAGIAGLAAATHLYTCIPSSDRLFDLTVVEGGNRIGGRISSSDFCGDRIEQGATWIHGIDGSPVYQIAREAGSLWSDQPWECMDGIPQRRVTVAEGGHVLDSCLVEPISRLYKRLMDFAQGKEDVSKDGDDGMREIATHCESVGSFLRRGLEAFHGVANTERQGIGKWSQEAIQEGMFAMHESVQRTYTSAHDLNDLDYGAEREYVMFPGEEITIARGYSSVVESLASILPRGMIQLGRRVERIGWQDEGIDRLIENGCESKAVTLHFTDGSTISADHVIVTVSLGVLKQGIRHDISLFNPPLPGFKTRAISRLGYGLVDKVFLRITTDLEQQQPDGFPFLQMVFHPPNSQFRNPKIPPWIRTTSFISPIYTNSKTLISWFTGPNALALESLPEDDIITGFSETVSNMLSLSESTNPDSPKPCSGTTGSSEMKYLERILRTQWGTNPLFLGSYSYIAVGSSIEDMDTLAEPLPQNRANPDHSSPPLQILFAGEATHSTHYSTTHGAYFSGLREANRLLKHFNYISYKF